jgi:hypothetical protein
MQKQEQPNLFYQEKGSAKMNARNAAMSVKQTIDHLKGTVETNVFNEWAMVQIHHNQWKVMMYQSPRKHGFKAHFKDDISSLKSLDPDHTQIGEFGFSNTGYGTQFDAYLCAGDHTFFIFNNTYKAANEITADPSWETAQAEFEDLQEQFILDPVE